MAPRGREERGGAVEERGQGRDVEGDKGERRGRSGADGGVTDRERKRERERHENFAFDRACTRETVEILEFRESFYPGCDDVTVTDRIIRAGQRAWPIAQIAPTKQTLRSNNMAAAREAKREASSSPLCPAGWLDNRFTSSFVRRWLRPLSYVFFNLLGNRMRTTDNSRRDLSRFVLQ